MISIRDRIPLRSLARVSEKHHQQLAAWIPWRGTSDGNVVELLQVA